MGADTVLIHDCDFNPQTDRQVSEQALRVTLPPKSPAACSGTDMHGAGTLQAEDRSHRLGQERPVTIYRMITDATVDADILSIAQVRFSAVCAQHQTAVKISFAA